MLGRMAVLTVVGWMAVSSMGCKAKPAPDSGFLEQANLMTEVKRAPFDRSYWDPQYDPNNYTELLVAPVNMDYVMAQNLWEKANFANLNPNVKQDLRNVAEYTQIAFVQAAEKDPKKHFRTVGTAGPKTLILETAIVQIVPSKAALNAVGYVFWEATAATVAGQAAAQSEDSGKGVIAIEGRLRDGATGKIMAMFADRERPKEAIINFKALTWWEPVKSVIDDWARQFIELSNVPKDKVVKRSAPFGLLIW